MLHAARILLITLALTSAALAQSAGGSLHGRVLDWMTGQPVADATVTLVYDRTTLVRRSGPDGQFYFESLPAGPHALRVAASGYSLKNSTQSITGSEYQVVDSSHSNDSELRIDLIPSGTISGIVRDANDKPLPLVQVVALRRQTNLYGEPILGRTNAAARTDSRGQYVLSGLSPGEYFLKAERQPAVFYPGVMDLRDATPLILGADNTAAIGIDIPVREDGLCRIAGWVVNPDAAESGIAVDQFYLMPRGEEDGVDLRTIASTAVARDGHFQIADVAPGLYDVAVTSTVKGRHYFGRTRLDVHSSDVADLRIDLYPATDIVGHVLAQPGTVLPDVSRMYAGLVRTEARIPGLNNGGGKIDRDGNIHLDSVLPDEYRLGVTGVPSGYYIDSIKLDNLEVGNEPVVAITSASSTLDVVLGSPAARVSGRALTSQGPPAVEPVLVVLVPVQSGGIKQGTTSGATGEFNFADIAPGRYRLLAFDKVPAGFPWNRTDFVEPYLSQATIVDVDGKNPVVVTTVVRTIQP